MIDRADIIIIGGGIIGCALFNQLAMNNSLDVILMEQGQLASKTTGESGGFIRKINPDPYLCALSSYSFDAYQQLANECGFVKTDLKTRISADQLLAIHKNIAGINQLSYPLDIKSVSPNEALIYESEAGFINTRLTCSYWVNAALRLGRRCYENTEVNKLLIQGDAICGVETTRGTIKARHVILATGAQCLQLLSPLGIKPPITIKSFQYNVYPAAARNLDCAIIDLLDGIYIFPLGNGDLLAGYLFEDRLTTHRCDKQVDYHQAATLHHLLSQHITGLSKKSYVLKKSFDAFTADNYGLLDYQSFHGLHLALGWSSGGIKIAPAVAKKLIEQLKTKGIQ